MPAGDRAEESWRKMSTHMLTLVSAYIAFHQPLRSPGLIQLVAYDVRRRFYRSISPVAARGVYPRATNLDLRPRLRETSGKRKASRELVHLHVRRGSCLPSYRTRLCCVWIWDLLCQRPGPERHAREADSLCAEMRHKRFRHLYVKYRSA